MSDRRRAREAKALAIVKAVRPDPSPRAQPLRHTELNGDTPEPTGFIYFLYCAGRIKIGYATEVADRMAQIATHCPFPIRLLLTIRGKIEDEKRFHERFASERVNREWFRLSLLGPIDQFLFRTLCAAGDVILANAQFDARRELASALADIIDQTGGDEDLADVEAAIWPPECPTSSSARPK